MKKLLASLLVVLLVLAGCSSNNSLVEEEPVQISLTDGTYEGVAQGMKGEVKVQVTVAEGKISDVAVMEQGETYGIGYGLETSPIETIPAAIVEAQGLGVDNVTGATITSAAVKTAAGKALEQAGGDLGALKKIGGSKAEAAENTMDSDVVIVGAGAAGLSAGISALDAGSTNVVIVEKQGVTGGATARSGGKVIGAPTEWQKKQGYEDSAQALYDYFFTMDGAEQLDEAKMKSFVFNSAENISWMEDMGVMIYDVEPIHSSLTPWRVLNTTNAEGHHGGGMIDGIGGNISVPLTEKYLEKGGKIVYNTSVDKINVDENGTITGIHATGKDGSVLTVNTDKVILATGGNASNREMNAKFNLPDYSTSVPAGNVGDGLKMAAELGARVVEGEAPHVVYVDHTAGVGINEEAGLIVNNKGERVANEYTYQFHVGNELYKSGSDCGYYITSGNDAAPMVQYAITQDVPQASSIEELAALINVDAETLKATVDRYNGFAKTGVDEDFGKPAEFLYPVEGEKYYALKMTPSVTVSFNGLQINENAEVLDTEGNPIEGLYAAGETAFTGLFGNEYPGCGMAISSSVYFGRIAGANAVAK